MNMVAKKKLKFESLRNFLTADQFLNGLGRESKSTFAWKTSLEYFL
jgi:hypothetical protein